MTPTTQAGLAFSIALAMLLQGCGWDRLEADREIDRLCKIDGGVKVIEHDVPPKEFLRPDGRIDIQELSRSTRLQSYYFDYAETVIRKEPLVTRLQLSLTRSSDQRVLGTTVFYMRPRDHSYIISPFAEHKVCPDLSTSSGLVTQVFNADVTSR